jgi:hypothetical protein
MAEERLVGTQSTKSLAVRAIDCVMYNRKLVHIPIRRRRLHLHVALLSSRWIGCGALQDNGNFSCLIGHNVAWREFENSHANSCVFIRTRTLLFSNNIRQATFDGTGGAKAWR